MNTRPSASELLAGNSKASAVRQAKVKCIYCDQSHWSDECSNYLTLQERRESLKGAPQKFMPNPLLTRTHHQICLVLKIWQTTTLLLLPVLMF